MVHLVGVLGNEISKEICRILLFLFDGSFMITETDIKVRDDVFVRATWSVLIAEQSGKRKIRERRRDRNSAMDT